MREHLKFYIDGKWVDPQQPNPHDVINPATEEVLYEVALGSAEDVNKAVAAARRAFETFSLTTAPPGVSAGAPGPGTAGS